MVKSPSSRRAWVEIIVYDGEELLGGSPSSRRAWVEISMPRLSRGSRAVALLAEGVGRNFFWLGLGGVRCLSPSSRRAWVEMATPVCPATPV